MMEDKHTTAECGKHLINDRVAGTEAICGKSPTAVEYIRKNWAACWCFECFLKGGYGYGSEVQERNP